jgi:hypothetical protein
MNGVHFRNSNSVTEYHSAPEFGPIRWIPFSPLQETCHKKWMPYHKWMKFSK